MRRFWVVAMTAAIVASCTGASSPSPAPSQATSAPPSAASASPLGWDANAISGTVVLSGWQASPDESNALIR